MFIENTFYILIIFWWNGMNVFVVVVVGGPLNRSWLTEISPRARYYYHKIHIHKTSCAEPCNITPTKGKKARSSVEEEEVVVNPNKKDQKIRIISSLHHHLKKWLEKLLAKYTDVFAWRPKHMNGIPRSIIEHRLNINPNFSLAKQKKRAMSREWNEIVNKEVADLVYAGVVRAT